MDYLSQIILVIPIKNPFQTIPWKVLQLQLTRTLMEQRY
jgi:hypothetical protein